MNKREKIIKLQDDAIRSLLLCYIFFMFIVIGMTMQFIVISNNGGKMPVLLNYDFNNDEHFSFQENFEVKNPYLADRFIIGNSIYSIGDITMIFFGFMLFVSSIFCIYNQRKLENEKKRQTKINKTPN